MLQISEKKLPGRFTCRRFLCFGEFAEGLEGAAEVVRREAGLVRGEMFAQGQRKTRIGRGTHCADRGRGEAVPIALALQRGEEERPHLFAGIFAHRPEGIGEDVGILLLRHPFAQGGEGGLGIIARETGDDLLTDAGVGLIEPTGEDLESLVRLGFGQGLGRLDADGVEGVGFQQALETVKAVLILPPTEGRRGEEASDRVAAVLELGVEEGIRRGELDRREHRHLRVDPHEFRLLRQGEVEILGRLVDAHGKVVLLSFLVDETDRQGKVEEQHLLARLLGLPHGQLGLSAQLVPRVIDRQGRFAAVEDPLIEKFIPRASRQLFKDAEQVVRLDVSIAMSLEIGADGLAVDLRPGLTPQHVEHPCAFRIGSVIELLHRIRVAAPDDGFFVRIREDSTRVFQQLITHLVPAGFLRVVEVRVVGRETLVEPELRPILAGDKIAEPLVRRLVRVETVRGAEIFRVSGKECARG